MPVNHGLAIENLKRKKWFALVPLFVLLLFFCCCEGKNLHGVVVDNFGKPVVGAEVNVIGTQLRTNTDSEGRYELLYAPGSFEVKAQANGYYSDSKKLNVTQQVRYPLDHFVLVQIPKSSDFNGLKIQGEKGYVEIPQKSVRKHKRLVNRAFRASCIDQLVPYEIPKFNEESFLGFFEKASGRDRVLVKAINGKLSSIPDNLLSGSCMSTSPTEAKDIARIDLENQVMLKGALDNGVYCLVDTRSNMLGFGNFIKGDPACFEITRTSTDFGAPKADTNSKEDRTGSGQQISLNQGGIFFFSDRDGSGDIYWMNSEGGQVKRITHVSFELKSAVLSPDRTRFLFNTDSGSGIMSLDGTIERTFGEKSIMCGAWSPTGQQIACNIFREGDFDIYLTDANGTSFKNISNQPHTDAYPNWSPDGLRIAFHTTRHDNPKDDYDGNWEIYSMNVDGSDQTRLTNNPKLDWLPVWSPDGKQIAFFSNRDGNWELYVMTAEGEGILKLTSEQGKTGKKFVADPVWSPDSDYLLYTTRFENEEDEEIIKISLDGQHRLRLTNSPGVDFAIGWLPCEKKGLFSFFEGLIAKIKKYF